MDGAINVAGRRFDPIVRREDGVSVCRGEGAYLRSGPAEKLRAEISRHHQMLELGFPVAEIIEEGEHEGLRYVIEASLGSDTLGERFDSEMQRGGVITVGSFGAFLGIVLRFAQAQLASARVERARDEFRRLLRVDDLKATLPDVAQQTEAAFDLAAWRLRAFPAVLTHGDLHAFNICERGVIDIETATWAPAGYDVVTALLLPDFFPPDRRDYRFSPEQHAGYLAAIDGLYSDLGLPLPFNHIDDFRLCKAIWLTARRDRPAALLTWLDDAYRAMVTNYLLS